MRAARAASGFQRLMMGAVVVLPFTVALWRSSGRSQWRADASGLRDLDLLPLGFGGAISTALTQLVSLLPLGSRVFRASFVSALSLAVACGALFAFARRMLERLGCGGRLGCLLSAIAACMAGLSSCWQREATVGGGAMPAVALVWLGLWLTLQLSDEHAPTLTPSASRGWLLVAILTGAATGENVAAGITLLLVALLTAWTAGKAPHRRLWLGMAGVFALVFAVLLAPWWLRPLSAVPLEPLGVQLGMETTQQTLQAALRGTLYAWLHEAGLVALVLAGLGLAIGLSRSTQRMWITPLVALLLVDLLYAVTTLRCVALDGLALGSLAVAAASGVAYVVTALRHWRIPMARSASVLLVVFDATVVAVISEEATFASDRSEHVAAEEWTDVALGQLPPRAAVLVHSLPLASRLWAAQRLEGRRPDVLLLAAPLLRHGKGAAQVLEREPQSLQLLQDLALTGQASELALSQVADQRPLLVAFDARWDERVLSHLMLDGAWLQFSAQPLGRSDRKTALPHVLARSGRIGASIHGGHAPDRGTAAVVVRTLKEHVTMLSLLGMSQPAQEVLAALADLAPDDPFVTGAQLRLAHAARARKPQVVELRDLLRYRAGS